MISEFGIAHSFLSIASRRENSITITNKEHKKLAVGIILATLWFLWKARNYRIFNNRSRTPISLSEEIKANTFNWIKFRSKSSSLHWHAWCNFIF
ncbi:hypothetical protein R6Q57_011929 [Mikania cordata]